MSDFKSLTIVIDDLNINNDELITPTTPEGQSTNWRRTFAPNAPARNTVYNTVNVVSHLMPLYTPPRQPIIARVPGAPKKARQTIF